jgi:hypothetical protein
MIPKALWFERSQHDKQNKQTNKQPSLINRFALYQFQYHVHTYLKVGKNQPWTQYHD